MARKRTDQSCTTMPEVQKLRDYLTIISLVVVIVGTVYSFVSKPINDMVSFKSDFRTLSLKVDNLSGDVNDLKDEIKLLRKYER